MRACLSAMSAQERIVHSQKLCQVMMLEPIWLKAQSILFFAPLPDEPDVTSLLDDALVRGKQVHLPRHDASADHYTSCRITTSADLTKGRFGILEPGPHCPAYSLNQLDFILVPGVAFDLTGRRLGRGKGYYDRLLAEVRGHKCGVCFQAQIVPSVPVQLHDVRVNSILTPLCWRPCPDAV